MALKRLGQLSVRDFEKKLNIRLEEKHREKLSDMLVDNDTDVGMGDIFIYDIPYTHILCGDNITRDSVIHIMNNYTFRKSLHLSVVKHKVGV